MMRIELSRSHRGARLKARLLARAKVKKANALQKCEVFASLDAKSISKIVDNMDYREIEGVICKKGDPAKELFVVVHGKCEVTIEGQHVDTMHELAVFGESAIFEENARRNATVTGNIKALVMSRSKWNMLLKSEVLSLACMNAMKAVRDKRSKNRSIHRDLGRNAPYRSTKL